MGVAETLGTGMENVVSSLEVELSRTEETRLSRRRHLIYTGFGEYVQEAKYIHITLKSLQSIPTIIPHLQALGVVRVEGSAGTA